MPAAALDEVLDDALAAGARAFIGIFAGLGESGPDGMARERAAALRIRRAGGLLLGPNCMGLADHTTGFQAVAYLDVPSGDIGFVSQSGAMGEEMVSRARAYGCGFSRYVTLGNQADVGIADVVRSFVGDGRTRAVALYAEGYPGGACACRGHGRRRARRNAGRAALARAQRGERAGGALAHRFAGAGRRRWSTRSAAPRVRCAWTRRASSSRSPWRWPPRRAPEGAASRW